jgi:hypothetical protein
MMVPELITGPNPEGLGTRLGGGGIDVAAEATMFDSEGRIRMLLAG